MRNKTDSPKWTTRKLAADTPPRTPSPSEDTPRHLRRNSPIRSFAREWCLCLLFCLLITLYLSHRYLQRSENWSAEWKQFHGSPREGVPVAQAINRTRVEGVGFALLGLGPFARQLKCEAAAESLRTHGGWDGPIFLFTDAPECYTQNPVWSECDIDAKIVDVNDDLSSGFALPSFYKTRGNRLRSKKYKTRIFELVPDQEIEVLVYMDCDMLVAGADHGLKEFLNEYVNQFDNDTQIFVFPENNPSQINGVVHTGIFIAHRTWSASVLRRWAEQLNTEVDASDQAAFVRAGITEYAFVDELKYLYRPRCDRDDCYKRKPHLFNHINGARCWSQGKDEIQTFVNRWGLCTYQEHNYCFPWYMTQFAMSWFPYTSCTKMEEERSIH